MSLTQPRRYRRDSQPTADARCDWPAYQHYHQICLEHALEAPTVSPYGTAHVRWRRSHLLPPRVPVGHLLHTISPAQGSTIARLGAHLLLLLPWVSLPHLWLHRVYLPHRRQSWIPISQKRWARITRCSSVARKLVLPGVLRRAGRLLHSCSIARRKGQGVGVEAR